MHKTQYIHLQSNLLLFYWYPDFLILQEHQVVGSILVNTTTSNTSTKPQEEFKVRLVLIITQRDHSKVLLSELLSSITLLLNLWVVLKFSYSCKSLHQGNLDHFSELDWSSKTTEIIINITSFLEQICWNKCRHMKTIN